MSDGEATQLREPFSGSTLGGVGDLHDLGSLTELPTELGGDDTPHGDPRREASSEATRGSGAPWLVILLPNLLFSQPKQRLLLDKAYRHLLDQGFGVLEPGPGRVQDVAKQLAEELGVGCSPRLDARGPAGSITCWRSL